MPETFSIDEVYASPETFSLDEVYGETPLSQAEVLRRAPNLIQAGNLAQASESLPEPASAPSLTPVISPIATREGLSPPLPVLLQSQIPQESFPADFPYDAVTWQALSPEGKREALTDYQEKKRREFETPILQIPEIQTGPETPAPLQAAVGAANVAGRFVSGLTAPKVFASGPVLAQPEVALPFMAGTTAGEIGRSIGRLSVRNEPRTVQETAETVLAPVPGLLMTRGAAELRPEYIGRLRPSTEVPVEFRPQANVPQRLSEAPPEQILAVAVRKPNGEIVEGELGTKHNDIAKEAGISEPAEGDRGYRVLNKDGSEEYQFGNAARRELLPVAEKAGQIKPDEELTPEEHALKDEGEVHGAMTKPPSAEDAIRRIESLPDEEAQNLNQKGESFKGLELKKEDVPKLESARKESHKRLMALAEEANKHPDDPEVSKAYKAEYGRGIWLSAAIEVANKKGPNFQAMVEQGFFKEPTATAKEAAAELPPVEEGKIRLYQGSGGPKGAGTGGAYWTRNPEKAATFGPNLEYVDVTKAEYEKLKSQKTGQGGDTVILTKSQLDKSKPVETPVQVPTIPIEESAISPTIESLQRELQTLQGLEQSPEVLARGKQITDEIAALKGIKPAEAAPEPAAQPAVEKAQAGVEQKYTHQTAFGSFIESQGFTHKDLSLPKLRTLAARDPEKWALLKKLFFGSESSKATVPQIHKLAQERIASDLAKQNSEPPPTAEVKNAALAPEAPPQPTAYGMSVGLPFGPVAPESVMLLDLASRMNSPLKSIFPKIREYWRGFAMKSAPKITDSSREAGEAGVEYHVAPMVGRAKGLEFAGRVLEDTNIKPDEFGAALSEDNLRAIRDAWNNELRKAVAEGRTDDAALLQNHVANVRTLVGAKNSPFKNEGEYQAFLLRDDVRAALERHKQLWAEQKDPLYRQANDLDPETPLPSRGKQTGARVNLKALQPDEPGVNPVGRIGGFRQLGTLRRLDPFARQAKGSGQAYESNYHEIMANGFGREYPVAKQHEFINQMIDAGDAVVSDKFYTPDLRLKNEGTNGYLLRLNPWRGKFLQVRKSLSSEYEGISGLDKPLNIPGLKQFNDFMTRQSIQGLAEGSTHVSNLMTEIFTGLGPTSNPMINALAKSLGRLDLLYSIPRVFIRAFQDNRAKMLELAEIGAAKQPYGGPIGKGLLNPVDVSIRSISSDIFDQMAEAGWLEKTKTNKREFINQVGNYHKGLQPLLIRKLRESGIQPFATAMQTFNVMGLRRLALAPGVKATSNAAALALRADIAAGWIGFIVLVTGLNKLISGKVTGPKGTPMGAIGWTDDSGKLHYLNVGRWLGYERGPRITGLLSYAESRRAGLSQSQSIEAGAKAVGTTVLSTFMGPGTRFLWISLFGTRPTQPWIQEAPVVPPTDSMSPFKTQLAKNIQTALIEANPIVSSISDLRNGKSIEEVSQRQFSRYTPRVGRTEEFYSALPRILDRKQLIEYSDNVAAEARKLPIGERYAFIQQRFEKDGLEPKYRKDALAEIKRRGTLKYR